MPSCVLSAGKGIYQVVWDSLGRTKDQGWFLPSSGINLNMTVSLIGLSDYVSVCQRCQLHWRWASIDISLNLPLFIVICFYCQIAIPTSYFLILIERNFANKICIFIGLMFAIFSLKYAVNSEMYLLSGSEDLQLVSVLLGRYGMCLTLFFITPFYHIFLICSCGMIQQFSGTAPKWKLTVFEFQRTCCGHLTLFLTSKLSFLFLLMWAKIPVLSKIRLYNCIWICGGNRLRINLYKITYVVSNIFSVFIMSSPFFYACRFKTHRINFKTYTVVTSNGNIIYVPAYTTRVTCKTVKPKVTKGQDDNQTAVTERKQCALNLGSWVFDGFSLNLTSYGADTSNLNTNALAGSGWKFSSINKKFKVSWVLVRLKIWKL